MAEAIRIANCSGFYGDRISAMREVLDGVNAGGPVDVITGDYLAELTMLILGRDQLKDAGLGYAKTFLTQVENCLGDALERGVKIVSNAGGLNPAGLAEKIREIARGLGLDPAVAHVEGDNLAARAAELGFPGVLTANAYLGAFGIAEALSAGADIVVTGRVTDASVVVGPAIAHHGWTPTAYDELAGAVVVGHVIECGAQACGGNFSGFLSLPRDGRPLGFPIAEVAADGSAVITKHDDTGGAVSVDTVTAQLTYEIQTGTYLNPDVSVDLTSIALAQQAPDRVLISGVRGGPAPERLKVATNVLGGYRNQMEFVLTGLDIEAKGDWVHTQLEASLEGRRPAEVVWTRDRLPDLAAGTEEAAACRLRVTVKDPGPDLVGRSFSAAVIELVLASYPGLHVTTPPSGASPYGIYRPAYVDRADVEHVVVLPDGERRVIADPVETAAVDPTSSASPVEPGSASVEPGPPLVEPVETRRIPLGTFVHARSGDKGGDANIGLWVGQDSGGQRADRVAWLLGFITPERIRELLPETRGLGVEVYPLPNLGGLNVLVRGLLEEGVAATTRFDPQAKAVGEWLRSRPVDVPEELF